MIVLYKYIGGYEGLNTREGKQQSKLEDILLKNKMVMNVRKLEIRRFLIIRECFQ